MAEAKPLMHSCVMVNFYYCFLIINIIKWRKQLIHFYKTQWSNPWVLTGLCQNLDCNLVTFNQKSYFILTFLCFSFQIHAVWWYDQRRSQMGLYSQNKTLISVFHNPVILILWYKSTNFCSFQNFLFHALSTHIEKINLGYKIAKLSI